MNIAEQIEFSSNKPAVASILKSGKLNIIAIGLIEGQELKKHQTGSSTLLTLVKGKLEFRIEGEMGSLSQYDTFQIPINTEHLVIGLDLENIFTLTQER